MVSACGVVCSECPAYGARAKGPAHQQETAEAWRRIYDVNESPERISCGGCLDPDEELFYTSLGCKARRCCRAHGFSNCAECPQELCPDLEAAQAVWDEVPNLVATLSDTDFARYAQPYCGHRQRLAAIRQGTRLA